MTFDEVIKKLGELKIRLIKKSDFVYERADHESARVMIFFTDGRTKIFRLNEIHTNCVVGNDEKDARIEYDLKDIKNIKRAYNVKIGHL